MLISLVAASSHHINYDICGDTDPLISLKKWSLKHPQKLNDKQTQIRSGFLIDLSCDIGYTVVKSLYKWVGFRVFFAPHSVLSQE